MHLDPTSECSPSQFPSLSIVGGKKTAFFAV